MTDATPPRAPTPGPHASSSTNDHETLMHLTSLLDRYWVATMSDGERVMILDDWLEILQGRPAAAIRLAKLQWLADPKRCKRAPQPGELCDLIDQAAADDERRLQRRSPASLTEPTTGLPFAALSLAQRWSWYARMHAFADAAGREHRPFDEDRRYYDLDLVAMARAEAMHSGKAAAWAAMRGADRAYTSEPARAADVVRPYWRQLRCLDLSAAELALADAGNQARRAALAATDTDAARRPAGRTRPAYTSLTYADLHQQLGGPP